MIEQEKQELAAELPPDEADLAEDEEASEESEEAVLLAALSELATRCDAAGIECEEAKSPLAAKPALRIRLTAGPGGRSVFIGSLGAAQDLLHVQFEQYRILDPYEAIVS